MLSARSLRSKLKRSLPKNSLQQRLEIAQSLHAGIAQEIDEIGSDLAELIGRRALSPLLRTKLRALLAKNNSLAIHLREEILQLRGMEEEERAKVKRVRQLTPLTKKESEILHLLDKAHTSREIAALEFISQATVKTHLASIYRKLSATNKTAALETARSAGLLTFK